MKSNYWLKLYHELNYDMKVHKLNDRQFRRMIQCFLLAGELDEDGRLPALDEMSFILHCDQEQLETELFNLTECRILSIMDGTYYVTNFTKWQKARSAAERKAYERKKDVKGVHYQLHDSHDIVTTCVTDKDKDKDKDKDIEGERDLSSAFTAKTDVQPHNNQRWTESIQDMTNAGITAEVMCEVIDKMDEDGLHVAGPWSVVNMAIAANSKNKRGTKRRYSKATEEDMI